MLLIDKFTLWSLSDGRNNKTNPDQLRRLTKREIETMRKLNWKNTFAGISTSRTHYLSKGIALVATADVVTTRA